MRLLFFCILLWPLYFTEVTHTFVIWNVGQGSWNTYISNTQCLHFDMGGEFYPKDVQKFCYSKKNYIYISHWHSDHYRFIPRFIKNVFHACIKRTTSDRAPRAINKILETHSCSTHDAPFNQQNSAPTQVLKEIKNTFANSRKASLDKNHTSLIFIFQNILIPGDITKEVEKLISHKLKTENIQRLIVPHHGSITSTSKYFLSNLPNVTLSIASARAKKYGHPHLEIKKRLKEKSLSLITTEDWGHIYFVY